jgi:type IV secretion system protein VirD4
MNRVALTLVPPVLLAFWTLTASYVTTWGLGTLDAIGWPTWQWWGYLITTMPDPGTQALVNQWLMIGAGVGGVAAALLGYRILTDGRALFGFEGRPLHGRSKFATRREGEQSGLIYSPAPRPDCLVLGRTGGWFSRYVCLPGPEHVMLYAKPGAGKGVSYVVANCFNYRDSLVVRDVKGENHRATAAHRAKRLRQDVFLFSPLSADGLTHCWNPLADITDASPDYLDKLHRIAYEFFPPVEGKEKFWQGRARDAFYGIAALLAETPGMPLNPGTVFRFFVRSDAIPVLSEMIEARRRSGHPYSQTCIDMISSYVSGTQEVVSGTRNHVAENMGMWFNPKLVAATDHSDFDLHDLRRRRMTVYIAVMPADIARLSVLLRLFFLQLFEANMAGMPGVDPGIRNQCHVMLDEFTTIGAMPPIAKSAGFARGFGLHFSFIVQSKSQISETYRHDGLATLFGTIGAEIIFGTDDPTLCREASERAGYDTVSTVSRSTPRFMGWLRPKEQSETEQAGRRALLLPQEVARMAPGMALMFRNTASPFFLKRLTWYTDKHFRKLAGKPPVPPRISYSIARDDGSVQLPVI